MRASRPPFYLQGRAAHAHQILYLSPPIPHTSHLINVTNSSNRPKISHVLHLAWKNFIIRDIAFHFRTDFPTESRHAGSDPHAAFTPNRNAKSLQLLLRLQKQGRPHTRLLSTHLKQHLSIPDSCFPLPKPMAYRHRVSFVEAYQRSLPSVQSDITEQKHRSTHLW